MRNALSKSEVRGIDGCPTLAQRTRISCQTCWRPVQEIRIRGTKMMGAAQRPLLMLDCPDYAPGPG
jgi:hypothetical protein